MGDIAIKVECLGKKYKIGHAKSGDLRETIGNFFKSQNFYKQTTQSPNQKSNDFWALKDITFEIQHGQAVGIIGHNGAGKSTLLKILSRITKPSTGRVEINGRVSTLLEVGTGFHPELTGRENIYLNGTILGMKRKEVREKFDEIVEFSGVAKFLDTPIKHYSSGMKVRLAFSVAAHLEPEILLIDEVLTVGDAEFQKRCLSKMDDIAASGRTILFVSHELAAVKKLCNRVILLNSAKIEMNSTPVETINYYLSNIEKKPELSISGTGGVSVLDVIFRNLDHEVITVVPMHSQIYIDLVCTAKTSMSDVSFSICFNNSNNTRVTSVWSSFIDHKFTIPKGKFVVRFSLRGIHLIPGEYKLISYVESKGQELERIDNFKSVIISYAPELQFAFAPKLSQGVYMEDYKCEIIETE